MTGTTVNSDVSNAIPIGSGPMWFDDPRRPEATAAAEGNIVADLVVIGGGYTGLWTAIHAAERDPSLTIAVVEMDRVGGAASGRNGGFVSTSLTHGLANGFNHWPDEMPALERLGRENLEGMDQDIQRLGIDCDFEWTGKVLVAVEQHQVAELRASVETASRFDKEILFLNQDEVRQRLNSPTFLAGTFDQHGNALVNPARLAWGLAEAAQKLGITIFEHTRVESIEDEGSAVSIKATNATFTAKQVALATNAFPSLLKRLRLYTVPVYDYALGTAPLTDEQLDAIGWSGREGFTDAGNEFHYYRLSKDNRILWGGYDAIYHYGSKIDPTFSERRRTFETLATHLYDTFPQLGEVAIDYAWGGIIDTCTRFNAFYGTAMKKKVGYALGFTGLGVGATRFAADVMLDLLAGIETERTQLEMVRKRPIPWPPEPARSLGINWTQSALAASDRNRGKRNLWLKTLDQVGVGFDS